ncbi:MAG: hypothetical protein IH586_05305 [Anaerolineaceae bacterium]|nr:hypothetical protein [Anaerolineaceae bacterium]
MDDDLQLLVHFFNDKEYLFKTITMAEISQVDEICNMISSQKGWFWPRFAKSERIAYMTRRVFVENELYENYTQEYGSLKEKIPVYFYLYPNFTKQKAIELGQQRMRHGETEPHILMVKIQDIKDIKNITFTLNDSYRAYWKKAMESGIPCRGDGNGYDVLPDHNKVFPFSMIEQIYQKYKAQHINYEIQVWDYQLLETMRYMILDKEETSTQPNTSSTGRA